MKLFSIFVSKNLWYKLQKIDNGIQYHIDYCQRNFKKSENWCRSIFVAFYNILEWNEKKIVVFQPGRFGPICKCKFKYLKKVGGKMVPGKSGPRKNGPRENGPRRNGPRKSVRQKLFSVKRMLENSNDFHFYRLIPLHT